MAEVTVEQLAKVAGVSVERLLDQLKKAGIEASADQVITDEQRKQLQKILLGGETTLRRKVGRASDEPSSGATVKVKVHKKKRVLERDSEFEKAERKKLEAEAKKRAAAEEAARRERELAEQKKAAEEAAALF